jgi:hypothetical protein
MYPDDFHASPQAINRVGLQSLSVGFSPSNPRWLHMDTAAFPPVICVSSVVEAAVAMMVSLRELGNETSCYLKSSHLFTEHRVEMASVSQYRQGNRARGCFEFSIAILNWSLINIVLG